MDNNWLNQVLQSNKTKSFVSRMYQDNPMTLDLGNGQHATHKMAWTEADGKYYAYPTVLFDGKQLVDFGPQKGFEHARSSGNVIQFNRPEEADYFSKNYKKVLKNQIFM